MAITNTAIPVRLFLDPVAQAGSITQSTVPGVGDGATIANFRALANMATAGVIPVEVKDANGVTRNVLIPVLLP
jgi:hypothetical protein